MNRIIRRSMIGILAGGAASAALIATAGHVGLNLLLGVAIRRSLCGQHRANSRRLSRQHDGGRRPRRAALGNSSA